MSEPFSGVNAQNDVVFTGTVQSWVFQDPSDNDYDFVYQVNNNSTSADSIERLTVASFAGFSTDADYVASTGATASFDATKDATGTVVGFDMNGGVSPNTDSDLLVVDTDSTSFSMHGNAALIDGGSGNATVDVPLASIGSHPVPEPASLAVLALFGGSMTLSRRRRKS